MSRLIDDEALAELKGLLQKLTGPVELVHFTQTPPCETCQMQRDLLDLIVGLSPKLTLKVYDLVKDADKARGYRVDKVPATVVSNGSNTGIRFFGITGGYEFSSLVEDILMVSAGDPGLDEATLALAALIESPLHLEVMVTLTCPYCPRMVRVVHQLALANPLVTADMVESSEFPQLVQRYQVGGVPRTVIDGGVGIEGALPAAQAVMEILKHVNPTAYTRLQEQLRDARGERQVRVPDPAHTYDVLVIGAGPAAMTATIYAARKAREVLVLGRDVGGQVVNTASIENWPGMPEVGGRDLAELLRNHAERYPLAERLGVTVTRIEQRKSKGGYFIASTDTGDRYLARTVIYCAGKQYRQLGVPGEQRFLGHGIAFCATCDAPLFRDKRVAVVGGGNSAFTAARDLLSYASSIHIINVAKAFQADKTLMREVTRSDKVTLHLSTHVREFLGTGQLSGVRLESDDGEYRQDLQVDGVFLEIGLIPNTAPVADLLELTNGGEIPVQRDQSTKVAGFFAAGDCTDEPEKQIVVAAGAGAKAALSADRYLG